MNRQTKICGQAPKKSSPGLNPGYFSDHAAILSKQEVRTLAWRNYRFEFGKRTYIAGILNCTPDSFSDGGRYLRPDDAVSRALEIAREGADIIDIGGESTRPGALPVSADEEIERVVPVIKRLKDLVSIPISIDTRKSVVARAALENGASMVNDVTGLRADNGMARVISEYDVPVIIMHMKGTPRTMQDNPRYDDVIGEIVSFLKESIDLAKRSGIDEEKIIIDPGIGFGKTLGHNLEILRNLGVFKSIGRPLMIGVSRKSFIGQILGEAPSAKRSFARFRERKVLRRLFGTAASVSLAIAQGADIIRVHDVKEQREAARIADSICRQ